MHQSRDGMSITWLESSASRRDAKTSAIDKYTGAARSEALASNGKPDRRSVIP